MCMLCHWNWRKITTWAKMGKSRLKIRNNRTYILHHTWLNFERQRNRFEIPTSASWFTPVCVIKSNHFCFALSIGVLVTTEVGGVRRTPQTLPLSLPPLSDASSQFKDQGEGHRKKFIQKKKGENAMISARSQEKNEPLWTAHV